MSKKIYLFSLVLLALTFTACSETEEAGRYDNCLLYTSDAADEL